MSKCQDSYFTCTSHFLYLSSPSVKIYFATNSTYLYFYRIYNLIIYSHGFSPMLMVTKFIFLPPTLISWPNGILDVLPGRASDWACLKLISPHHTPTKPAAASTFLFLAAGPTSHSGTQARLGSRVDSTLSPTSHDTAVNYFPSLVASPFLLPLRSSHAQHLLPGHCHGLPAPCFRAALLPECCFLFLSFFFWRKCTLLDPR